MASTKGDMSEKARITADESLRTAISNGGFRKILGLLMCAESELVSSLENGPTKNRRD